MGKFIYESHMGGLFCSEEQLDYDYLYCETCGDSDFLIGYANNIEEAWKLLESMTDTFDDSVCEKCEHCEDDDYCYSQCEEMKNSGGYDLAYVMQFLSKNFDSKESHYVYLLVRHSEDNEYVFLNCHPEGYKFGEKHSIPYKVTPIEKFVPLLAKELFILLDGEAVNFQEVTTKKIGNNTYHVFSCIEQYSKEDCDNNWKEAAQYKDNTWYGYVKKENCKILDEQKFIFEEIFDEKSNLP